MSHYDLDRLAFRNFLERIAAGTYTPRGKRLVEECTPAPDLKAVQERQEVHSEIARTLEGDDRPPFEPVPDLDSILSALTKPGVILEGDQLWDMRTAIAVLEMIGKYFAGSGKALLPSFVKQYGFPSRYGLELKELDGALEQGGMVRDDATPALERLRNRLRKQEEKIRTLARSIAERLFREGWAQEPEPVLREGRHVIAVRSDARSRVQGVALDRSRSGQTVFIEPQEISEAGLEVKQLRRDEEQEVVRILAHLSSLCATRSDEIDADLDRLAVIDAAQAAMRCSDAGPMMLPAVGDGGTLELHEARHPLLASTHGPQQVVPLTLSLEDGSRTLVISGPNSGGKTVALQTVGLCIALALCGLPIPAGEGSRIPFIDHIHVDIGDEQSLEADLSTFTARLIRLRAMLEQAEEGKLCLIDEAGAGTDPGQGAALAIAVLERLTFEDAFVVCATHDGRIKTHAAQASGMINGRMIFSEKALTPTYEFRSGEPGRSFAFEIAERSGLPADLVSQARDLLGTAENDLEDALRQAGEMREDARKLRREAETDSRRAGEERRKYESLANELAADAELERRVAAEQAREIVKEARRSIEGLVREIRESNAAPAAIRKAHQTIAEIARNAEDQATKAVGGRGDPDAPLQEGDEVYLVSLERPAIVQSVGGRRVRVRAGSLSLDVARDDIEPIAEKGAHRPGRGKIEAASGPPGSGGVRTPLKSVSQTLDIIGQRADEARQTLEKYLDDAILAGLENIAVIHGSGRGVLRRVVEEVLKNHSSVEEYGLDTRAPGGTGVTRVRLKGDAP